MTNQGIDRAAISRDVRKFVAGAALESLRPRPQGDRAVQRSLR
jgi:hypothetical protein